MLFCSHDKEPVLVSTVSPPACRPPGTHQLHELPCVAAACLSDCLFDWLCHSVRRSRHVCRVLRCALTSLSAGRTDGQTDRRELGGGAWGGGWHVRISAAAKSAFGLRLERIIQRQEGRKLWGLTVKLRVNERGKQARARSKCTDTHTQAEPRQQLAVVGLCGCRWSVLCPDAGMPFYFFSNTFFVIRTKRCSQLDKSSCNSSSLIPGLDAADFIFTHPPEKEHTDTS